MLNPQGGARNLLIKNVDPSIRKPSAPEEECTARAAQQYRKQRKAVVAALLEAHENGAIEERHLLETHNRGEIGEKTLCDFECSIQQPFAVQPTSFQTEANFVDPNRTLLPMPQQLLSHNEKDLVGYGKTLFPVSQEPHSRIEVDSGTNMDVLFTAIEIHQTVNAGTFATDNTPTDIGGPLNHPAPFDSCVPSEDAPADSKNDSGWASFKAHSNLESTRMEDKEKMCVLVYDEMSVQSTAEYDKKNDEVIGPHSEMQVVMARGLFSQWKQPIFVDFDVQVTKDLLENLITQLFKIGFNVIANVHDCGAGNWGVWRDCGVNFETKQTSMKHPCTGKDVFFFPDAPYQYKLFRNWMLDHGFMYKGKLVTKKFLELLVQKASTLKRPFSENGEGSSVEFNSLFKLTSKHLTVQGSERQNVRLAAELLSHTTAVNLRRHFGQYEEARLLAEIIEIVNKWFDVMNSYSLTENVPSKKCYGLELEQQNQILDNMETLIKEIRVLSKHCLPAASGLKLFQKAILISIESTRQLLTEIRKLPGLEQGFVMMYKCNQDSAENGFALIRLNGGTHDHPTPLQALERLRLMILGKGLSRQLKVNQNTQSIIFEEDYLISKVFRKANIYLENNNEDDEQSSDEEDSWVYEPNIRELEEADGYEYVMGYIAKTEMKNQSNLGSYTYQLEQECEPEINKENYVQDLSYGGLVQPSEEWLEVGNQLDSCFNWIHNTGPAGDQIGFRNKKNVNQRTFRKLKQKFPHLPDHVLKNFSKRRVSIRVRHLKKQLQEKKILKTKNRMAKKKKTTTAATHSALVDERSAIVKKNARKLKHFVT
ncbi:transposable element P transposase [Aedes albopictus]|uniref:Uncharacterized protein n=1 Tax=Aedes albopictus TaxID=7160 RepID=A0ABM1ZLC9_AEDAL